MSFCVKLHNKLDALDKLMKHFGMYQKDNKQRGMALADDIIAARRRVRMQEKEEGDHIFY